MGPPLYSTYRKCQPEPPSDPSESTSGDMDDEHSDCEGSTCDSHGSMPSLGDPSPSPSPPISPFSSPERRALRQSPSSIHEGDPSPSPSPPISPFSSPERRALRHWLRSQEANQSATSTRGVYARRDRATFLWDHDAFIDQLAQTRTDPEEMRRLLDFWGFGPDGAPHSEIARPSSPSDAVPSDSEASHSPGPGPPLVDDSTSPLRTQLLDSPDLNSVSDSSLLSHINDHPVAPESPSLPPLPLIPSTYVERYHDGAWVQYAASPTSIPDRPYVRLEITDIGSTAAHGQPEHHSTTMDPETFIHAFQSWDVPHLTTTTSPLSSHETSPPSSHPRSTRSTAAMMQASWQRAIANVLRARQVATPPHSPSSSPSSVPADALPRVQHS
ncbi:hypothetical protein C8Q76DRAFT_790435 [Earliella scabrosa]|nr:hypothetical protein C8Q76DRAFT_790435 [Earliella scabrosa]